MRSLGFTMNDLSRIFAMKKAELKPILDNLLEFQLIEYDKKHRYYLFAKTEHALAFDVFIRKLLLWNLDRLNRSINVRQSKK